MPEPEPTFDVAILGYGPVGALLANLLGQAGLAVVVLERDARIHPLPRAVHFDGEVMRIFQAAGLAERIEAIARPSSKGMHFVNAQGETLLVRRSTDGPGPHGWANDWYFHQPDLDAVLREGVARFPEVQVRLRHEVFSIRDVGERVSLGARDTTTGSRLQLEARYAVGCDGSRSLMREVIGSTLENLGLHQPWLVVDVLADPGSARATRLPDYTVQHCDPRRPMTRVHVGGVRHRWEIMLMPGDDADTIIEPEHFWPLLADAIGPRDAVIERSAVYTFHSLIAARWRRGRLLLAGDSCHQTPPFLGQGMCAGMRDAANLAWKLDLVLHGKTGESLLDTYESERRSHVHTFVELAVRLGAIIQATEPAAVEARDRQLRTGAPRMFDFPQPQLGPGAWVEGPPPIGAVFPQPRLDEGRRLDDAIGNRFAVLAEAPVLAGLDADLNLRWPELDVAVIDAPGDDIRDWLIQNEAAAVVLRPDRYVFGLAHDARELAQLTSRLPGCARANVAV